MPKNILNTNESSFHQDVLMHKGLILVDLWADWCGPCKSLSPILDELSEDYSGQLTVAKINADENPQLSQTLVVRSLPTMILYKNGTEVERVHGLIGKSRLAILIENHLEA